MNFLNNLRLKSNTYNSWRTTSKVAYRENLHISLYIRELIETKFRQCYSFIICYVNVDIKQVRKETNVHINFEYVKKAKKIEYQEIKNQILEALAPVKKRYAVKKIDATGHLNENPFTNAMYVAQHIVKEMRFRTNYRALKNILNQTISSGCSGCIISIKGRINGYSITRKDKMMSGTISRNTINNKLQYAKATYIGNSGCVGVKVWISLGKIVKPQQQAINYSKIIKQ